MSDVIDYLNGMYKEANKLYKESSMFKNESDKCTLRLQQGDPEMIEHWRFIMAISVVALQENYQLLGVDMPLWAIRGESFYAGQTPLTEKELVCAKLTLDFFDSDGNFPTTGILGDFGNKMRKRFAAQENDTDNK